MAQHTRVFGAFCLASAAVLLLISTPLVLGCGGSDDEARQDTTSTIAGSTTSTVVEDSQVAVAGVAPELAVFGNLAAVEGPPVSASFSSDGGRLDLADGATLTVPAGVFADDTSLSVVVVGLALGYLDRRVGVASAYMIESDRDLSSLAEPVILEIPFPSEICGVAMLEAGQWAGVDIPAGETTRVEISHFSRNLITFIPAATEFIQQLGWTLGKSGEWLKPSAAERVAMEEKHQQWVRTRSDQWTRDFYGLDENGEYRPPTRTQDEMCRELQAALGGYTDFSLPEDYNWLPGSQMDQRINEFELFRFLIAADNPRTMGSWFWDYTSASMDVIDERVRASTSPLTPAEVLTIAVEANGGNVPLGLLAAHNYLKDIAYGGRLQGDPGTEGAQSNVAQRLGEAASHLEPWREVVPTNPVGRLDKMGPIYHIFAAAVAEVWWREKAAGSQNMGQIVSLGEQLMRIGFFTAFSEKTGIPINEVIDDKNDVPDVDKGAADLCGARLGTSVIALGRGEKPPAVTENTPPVAENLTLSVTPGASVAITLKGSDADGDALTYTHNQPANGTLSGTAPSLTYKPNAGFAGGADSFTYRVNDGAADSSVATVSIEVKELRYKGKVAVLSKPPLPVYELSASSVELAMANGAVSVLVEFTLVAVLKWEGQTHLCTATMHRVYQGKGPLAERFSVELVLTDSSDKLEGPDTGGVVPTVVKTQVLEGTFSGDGKTFKGNIRNAWQITATRVGAG